MRHNARHERALFLARHKRMPGGQPWPKEKNGRDWPQDRWGRPMRPLWA
jgi:hypothetical protein